MTRTSVSGRESGELQIEQIDLANVAGISMR